MKKGLTLWGRQIWQKIPAEDLAVGGPVPILEIPFFQGNAQFDFAVHLELRQNLANVRLDRSSRNIKLGSNFIVSVIETDQSRHFLLARG